ncbi:hypothetical protein [Leptospira barantonii]|uniref:Glycosyl transferase n=1 Tax=Leptospira barantonii TaxID=2023184 RepID=A0ABX4NKE3_9LEPT|nr:hypothetical protein [Leptospira barantonii]PJZ57274.1 hypothetical protein CH367_11120 [Leptospira barantonii]
MKKVLWIANADARGHLFRAHLAWTVLRTSEIHVSIVTTNADGKKFLEALGTTSAVLPGNYRLYYDSRQNLIRILTVFKMAFYLLFGNAVRDLLFLKKISKEFDLILNDLHPVPIFASKFFTVDIIHVYGENLWLTIENYFFGIAPRFFAIFFRDTVRKLKNQSKGNIVHSLIQQERKADEIYLPPLVHFTPRKKSKNTALVYLNPYFSDSYLAESLEEALDDLKIPYVAIGEQYAHRKNWRSYDTNFSKILSESKLVISAPGMNLLAQVLYHRVPYLALSTDQPEQEKNLEVLKKIDSKLFTSIDVSNQTDLYPLLIQNIRILLTQKRNQNSNTFPNLKNSSDLWTSTIRYFLEHEVKR